jgi:hypothetical protein
MLLPAKLPQNPISQLEIPTTPSNVLISMQSKKNVKNQRNLTLPKEHSNFVIINPKGMEIYKLPTKNPKHLFEGNLADYKKTQRDNSTKQNKRKKRSLIEILKSYKRTKQKFQS